MMKRKEKKIYICTDRMDVNRIKRSLGLNEESEVVHLLHAPLERAGDKISEQRPGSFPEDEMPGAADFLLVAVDSQANELSDEVQPKLIGVPVRTMLLDGQGSIEKESTLLLDPRTPGVRCFLATRAEWTDEVLGSTGKRPGWRRTSSLKLAELRGKAINNRLTTL